jgi:serine phosphatase RsbU (regulator of sigma subunit)
MRRAEVGVSDPLDRPIGRLLRLAQVTSPQDIVEALALSVAEIDGTDVVLYLLDYDQAHLRLYPRTPGEEQHQAIVTIEGSMPGRVFLSCRPLAAQRPDGWHVWIPVTERAERLGVLSMTLPAWDDAIEDFCVELGYTTAHLILVSSRYTDRFECARRHKSMSLPAEMQCKLLPPLAFNIATTTVAGLLEPAYEVAGDCFDYALNGLDLDVAIFDAVGHGLESTLLSSLAVSAYRHGRRDEGELRELVDDMDEAIRGYATGHAFVTGLVARLDIRTGRVRWLSAGHPAPLHVRRAAVLPEAGFKPGLPLGLRREFGYTSFEVVETTLEPGDALLLYTDGVVDADADGEPFGEERLRDLVERECASERAPHEILRRLVRAIIDYHHTSLRDDASMVLVHWDGPPEP